MKKTINSSALQLKLQTLRVLQVPELRGIDGGIGTNDRTRVSKSYANECCA